jgi:CTD kinase subunit beta
MVIGLERLMLEASGFDFRVRFPHKHIIKLAKDSKVDSDVARTAYNIMLDLYRTFAPLKQSCAAMSFACIELATLLLEKQENRIHGERQPSYRKWHTKRAEVMETILDLLEHYTHFQKSSAIGSSYPIDTFINIRIRINKELEHEFDLARYTEQYEAPKTNGKLNIITPKTPVTPASPSDLRINGKDIASSAAVSPRSAGSGKRGIGARGQEGTVRFMLDGEEAKREKAAVDEYYNVEYEEYEEEVEETIKVERVDHHHNRHHNGHDERYRRGHFNKRGRR